MSMFSCCWRNIKSTWTTRNTQRPCMLSWSNPFKSLFLGCSNSIPSGKRLHNYGKSPFLGKSTNLVVIFHFANCKRLPGRQLVHGKTAEPGSSPPGSPGPFLPQKRQALAHRAALLTIRQLVAHRLVLERHQVHQEKKTAKHPRSHRWNPMSGCLWDYNVVGL